MRGAHTTMTARSARLSQESLASMDGQLDTWRRFGRVALEAGLVGIALFHPLAALLARLDWRADLVTHFTLPALTVTLIAAAGLLRGHPRLAFGLSCLAIWQAAPLFRYTAPSPVRPDPRAPLRLRVLMANVLAENTRYADVDRLIRRERPDIVGLVEVTPEWLAGLAAIRAKYPYRVEVPDGTTGLALWFREPPMVIDTPVQPLPGASPLIHAEFRFGGRPRHLWLVHPDMPFTRKDRPEIPALAALIGRTSGSRIVVGDMNTTEGSPWFADFLSTTGLRDSRLGFGRQPSWPSDLPYRIALEHAFLSDDLAVVARRLGPMVGSDHFPLILDLAPAAGTLDGAVDPTSATSHPSAISGSGRGG
jgi:endonuclease/exonuclease/phosphatase (EEP) superfamily protein YafD